MLFRSKFDCKTQGLVCGEDILQSNFHITTPIIKRKNRYVIWDAKKINNKLLGTTYKIVIRSFETKEEIWVRPFATKQEAMFCYLSLIGIGQPNNEVLFPSVWQDGDLEYVFATVRTFNATTTDNTKDWASGGTLVPFGTTKTDYLVVAQGGGGGVRVGGGGGAGGYKTATNFSVTAGASVTITVGASAGDRKSTRLNSSDVSESRMPSSA